MLPHSFTFLFFSTQISFILAGPKEKDIIKMIMNDYYTSERPVENDAKPVDVKFKVTLKQIVDIEEKTQIFYSQIWLTMTWSDYRLNWSNDSRLSQVPKVLIPVEKLWFPDILLYNSATENFDPTYKTNAEVYKDGKVQWLPPGKFASTCAMDITWFPYDLQNCKMQFGSWSNSNRTLMLNPEMAWAETSDVTPNGEWELISMNGSVEMIDYGEIGWWVFNIYEVKMRRKPLYFVFNIVIPTILISCIGLLTFFVPPEAGEKVSLAVTILLALSVFMMMIASMLPTSSDAVPLLGLYFILEIGLCSLSCFTTVLVLNYHHRSAETHTMPAWVQIYINGHLAYLLRMKRPGTTDGKPKEIREELRKKDLKEKEEAEGLDSLPPALPPRCKLHRGESNGSVDVFYITRNILGDILAEIKTITNKMRGDDEDDKVTSDWSFAAMVIDRLCAVITVLATIIVTIVTATPINFVIGD